MSAFTRMEEECDALEEKVAELERENRLLRVQYDRRVEERDAQMKKVIAARDEGWTLGVEWAAQKGEKIIEGLKAQKADLLAALEAMLDTTHRCGEDCVMSEPCPVGEQARDVIAKAKKEGK